MRVVIGVLLALVWVSGCQSVGTPPVEPTPAPTRLDLSEEDLGDEQESWFGVYSSGRKVGWSYNNYRRVNGQPVIEQVQTIRTDLGERQTFEQLVFSAEPPYDLVAARSTFREGAFDRRTELRRQLDGTMKVTTRESGIADHDVIDGVVFNLADAFTPSLWLAQPRRIGDRVVSRDFGPTRLNASSITHEVVAEGETRVDGIQVVHRIVSFEAEDGSKSAVTVDSEGQVLRIVTAGTLEFRKEDQEAARDIEHTADLFQSRMVRTSRPLGQLADRGAVTLESVLFKNRRLQLPLPTEPVTERVMYLPKKPLPLAGEHALRLDEEPGTMAWARELTAYVASLVADQYRAGTIELEQLLLNPVGDCTEHARVFVALSGAAGVPARKVVGLVYAADLSRFVTHTWCEVAIGGDWIPADPTLDIFPAGRSHLPERVLESEWPEDREHHVIDVLEAS